jgi:hypothetical protein
MTFPRRLEVELLDQLPADDPRAIRSRRDLKRVNTFMSNARCMASLLQTHAAGRVPQTILDLGSGDGAFMLRVAHRLAPRWQNVKVILLDRQNIVSEATRKSFAALQWQTETVSADVFEFLDGRQFADVEIVTANLFLHHFTDEQLRRLFANTARHAWLVAACEPRRAKFVVEVSRTLWAVGCNDVTIHDAVASARAGFAGTELSALWPSDAAWELHERPAALFTHGFAARRGDQPSVNSRSAN